MQPLDLVRSRVRFDSIEHDTTRDGHCRVTVRLEWADVLYEASARDLDTQHGVIKAASRATLQAALDAAGTDIRLEMVGVKAVRAFDGWIVVTRLHGGVGDEARQLLGCAPCENEDELPTASVQAVLAASNRVLERVLPRLDRRR